MLEKFSRYRIFFIIAVVIFCSIFIESPYHGDYYRESPYLFYFLITFMNVLVYLIPTDKFIFIEKFIYSAIISFVVLIFGGMFIEKAMGVLYDYDTNWNELKSPALLDNTLFYFVTTFSGIGILAIWLRSRKPIYD